MRRVEWESRKQEAYRKEVSRLTLAIYVDNGRVVLVEVYANLTNNFKVLTEGTEYIVTYLDNARKQVEGEGEA